ncbi:MAG: glycine dehydrogenase (aminomethyl-transferring) [Candidatus Fraserbacteria bacterium RBG_16_55_9]|uniref:Probable glycine dehydrogenase (decarboxylating) subunit 1 n=1 Tax=Fraserbacteria sp. (strain RBG_16_55_9) TaxID=1817864 RepID=A0A1F5UR30_FRAXR|nr:MAG: glycine dehydrogenase (aminomethyl-transferring) [Candidatus Fraserbacteria bacterium RBG_16_55_9]
MSEFIPHTPKDQREMLQAIGLTSIDELFADIPHEILERYKPLGVKPLSELEAKQLFTQMASENIDPTRYISFLGGGVYDHHIPSVVSHLILRSEFFTSYTPYQAEASQGTLTWMFEFQTMVCELTGMDVANASMYDGGSAIAEAMLMAHNISDKKRFLVAKSVHPHYRQIIETYAWAAGLELTEVPYDANGQIDRDFIKNHATDDLGGLLIQTPNFFGLIEDLSSLKSTLGDALLCVSVHPLSLGILRPPGEFGADIVVSEGQVLGNAPNFGGPLLGLFACKNAHLRKMPGRISGRTTDAKGNVGYIMTLQAREQHIRRAKATSNICTNQALCALGATIYLASLGKRGFRRLAELNAQKAHYLARKLQATRGFSLKWPKAPFFNEFSVQTPVKPSQLLDRLRDEGFLGGLDLEPYGHERTLLIAVTEKRTRQELDRFAKALQEVAR